MKKVVLVALFMVGLLADNNITKLGERVYIENSCNSCHGNFAEGSGSAPKLIGLKEKYLIERLNELKSGKVRSAFGGIMVSFAKALDENQTKAVSKYLSTLKKDTNIERYDVEFDPSDDGSS